MDGFLPLPGLGWHQYKCTFCTHKTGHVEKMQKGQFSRCHPQKRLRFWYARWVLNFKDGIPVIYSFQSLSRCVCMSLYIMQYLVQKRESKNALLHEKRIWRKISFGTSKVFFFHSLHYHHYGFITSSWTAALTCMRDSQTQVWLTPEASLS